MCVERTDRASGDKISAPWPAGGLGRADRRMAGMLAGWLGQEPAVLLRDGVEGEELNPNLLLRVVNHSRAWRRFGQRVVISNAHYWRRTDGERAQRQESRFGGEAVRHRVSEGACSG